MNSQRNRRERRKKVFRRVKCGKRNRRSAVPVCKIRHALLKSRRILFFENLQCGNEKHLARCRSGLNLRLDMSSVLRGNNAPLHKFVYKRRLSHDCSRRSRLDKLTLRHLLGDFGRKVWRWGHNHLDLERKRLGFRIIARFKAGQKPLECSRIMLLYQYFREGDKGFLAIFVPAKLLIRNNKELKGNAILRHKLEHLLKIRHAFGKARIKFRFFCHTKDILANTMPYTGTNLAYRVA